MKITDRIFRSVTSFRSKQQLIIMMVCLIVLSASILSTLGYEAVAFKRDSRARLEVLADIIAADISAALAFGDANAIDKTLQTLALDQSIIQVLVLNTQGEPAGWYARGDLSQIPADIEQRLKHLTQDLSRPIFDFSPEVSRPVIFNGTHLGNILVELDSNVFVRKMMVSGGIGAIILLLSVLGSYFLARRLGRVVTDPVQSLATTIDVITRTRDYSVRAEVPGLTELAQLSRGFNEMLGEIAQRDEAILESGYRWKFALEGSGDGVWDWDIRTDSAAYSKRWKEMLGYAEGDIMPTNQEWVDRIHPDDSEYVAGSMRAYLEGRTENYVVEYRLRCKDGSYKWILGRGMVVSRDNDNRPLRMIGTNTDISERKLVEEELRKKNAEVEQFLYTVSHDLRTPLVTVKTFVGFLENDMLDGNQPRIKQDLQFIHGAADKMKLLLDELLNLSRIGRVETPSVRVPLRVVIDEVLDVMAGVICERNVDVIVSEMNLELFGDRPRLCQIWQNLLENAIKYSRMDCFPRIELGVVQDKGETVFFVKDNGIGIDPQYHEKIFGIFEKLDPKSSGAGLGLSMIQRIVEKCGGKIWVESEGVDKGSCFNFTLPHVITEGSIMPFTEANTPGGCD